MATWYGGIDRIWDNGFGDSRDGGTIEGAMFHHVGGTDGQAYVANWNDRDSHPSYHIKSSGYSTGIVHPNKQPSSINSKYSSVDRVSISFEIDNVSTGGNWPVSDAALNEAIDICVHHAREQGLKRFAKNTPGVDQPGVFFIGWHQQYQSTGCPGPHILAHIDWIVAECQRRLDGGAPGPAPTPEPAGGYEASDFGIGTNATREQWVVIQKWLAILGRYDGPIDGVPGPNTWKGIQITLTKYGYYSGPIDGIPGYNTARGMQMYGRDGGGYGGPIDGDLGPNSWIGFVARLSS